MQPDEIPPMKPLAPLVDRMRGLAMEELPAPRTCTIHLWDDGTFDVVISHKLGDDERQCIRYERTTGQILWECVRGAQFESEPMPGKETLHEPVYEECEVRVVATVTPPF